MPTLEQLPQAVLVDTSDVIMLDQQGVTRTATVATLQAGLQPTLTLAQGVLLGRVSIGPGRPEPVGIGAGLKLSDGALVTDGQSIASLGSPSFTGTPTAPTPPAGDSSDAIATTAFVQGRLNQAVTLAGDVSGASGPNGIINASLPAITTPGTFTKLTVNAKGQVVAGASLSAADVGGFDLSQSTSHAAGATSPATLANRAGLTLDLALDFAGDPTGLLDSTVALQAGINALSAAGGGNLRVVGQFKISSTITIVTSNVGLVGVGHGQLHSDNSWTAPSRLIWAGATGGTMVSIAPVADTIGGKALLGNVLRDILIDCASVAAVGLYIGSVRHGAFDFGYLNPKSGTSLQAGVVFDTVDIAEYNDCQMNICSIIGAELGSGGKGVLLQAKSRNCKALPVGGGAPAPYYGNTSYNIFQKLELHYWRGVPLTLRETDNNVFELWGINAPPLIPAAFAVPPYANANSIELEGSSDPVWAFPALNNVFIHGGCAGPIMCRGTPSFTAASGQTGGIAYANLFLQLDKGNGVPDPTVESGATAYFGDLNFIDNGRAITQAVLSDTRAAVTSLRTTIAPGGPVLHASNGPASRYVAPAMAHSWSVAPADDGSLSIIPAGASETRILLGNNTANVVQGVGGFVAGLPAQSQLVLNGAPNGGVPTLSASSSTTSNVSLALQTQGSGTIYFLNGHGIQFQISDSGVPAANFIDVLAGATGVAPRLQVYGTDANIDLLLGGQGTGLVRGTTPPATDNSTAFATTAYVRAQNYVPTTSNGAASGFTSSWTSGNPGLGAWQWNITGSVPNAGVIGEQSTVYNNGPNSAQGSKYSYFTSAGAANSVDNAATIIGVFNPTGVAGANMGAELVRWTVGITPQDVTHNWTHVAEEYNVVNRGLDIGWKAYRNDPVNNIVGPQQITGLVNYSPEATGLGQPGEGKNLLFAELFGQSASNNSSGLPARFYNASLYEPNCVVGGTGRAIYINGDLTGLAPQIPFAPLEVSLSWLHGLRTTTAVFQDGQAFTMASGQSVAWSNGSSTATMQATGAGANQDIVLSPAGSGSVRAASIVATTVTASASTGLSLATSQGSVLQVKDNGVAALSKLVLTPGNGGASAVLAVVGETNQGLVIRSAGTGQINFQSGSGGNSNALTINANPTAVNALSLTGGSSGQNVVLGVNGADPNVSIQISPQGTGTVYINKLQAAGGSIDAVPIGQNTASTGVFTTIKTTGLVTGAGGFADASYSSQTPISGFAISIGNGVSTLQLTPAGPLASGTITMPTAPGNGQWLLITSTASITACGFLPSSGQSIIGAPTSLPAYVEVAFQYQVAANRWICQSGNDARVASVATTASLLFGTGADGIASISAGMTTLARDMHYTNLTISGTGTINTAGWRIFVSGVLDLSAAAAGAIVANGTSSNNAAGAAAGAAPGGISARTVGQSPASGGAGGNGATGAGAAGSSGASATYGNGGNGGAAGAGGAATSAGGAGAAGGVETVQLLLNTPTKEFWMPASNASLAAGLIGGGGGGGGGDGTNLGGGGGSGGSYGGTIALYARNFQRGTNGTASLIQARGSAGGNGAAGIAGNAAGGGGGGGGGGGLIYIVTEMLLGTPIPSALDASGGPGGGGGNGSGTGRGGNGGSGGASGSVQIVNLLAPAFSGSAWNAAGTAGTTTATPTAGTGGVGAQLRITL